MLKKRNRRRLNRGAAVNAAAAAAQPSSSSSSSSRSSMRHTCSRIYCRSFASPYFEQGADTDTLYYCSGLLKDLRAFFEKYRINSVIQDKIFYGSIKKLIDLYDAGKVYNYIEIISHTLKASETAIEPTITEIKDLLKDSEGEEVDMEKMDDLLGILYRDMISNVDPDIDPKDKIQDLKGEGFKAVAKAQADPLIATQKKI